MPHFLCAQSNPSFSFPHPLLRLISQVSFMAEQELAEVTLFSLSDENGTYTNPSLLSVGKQQCPFPSTSSSFTCTLLRGAERRRILLIHSPCIKAAICLFYIPPQKRQITVWEVIYFGKTAEESLSHLKTTACSKMSFLNQSPFLTGFTYQAAIL